MKRNTLTTAVLAGLTGMAGMVSVSNAVNVNPDGLGQVLLYPYYSTRGGNDTLISVVNTTDQGKAVKIRFIEALNSREVLDFNIYLSEYDVWTAGITDNAAGGAKMVTADTTCTSPYWVGQAGGPGNVASVDFLDFAYTGAVDDGGPQGPDRQRSGYIEIIEMGVLGVDDENGEDVDWAATHRTSDPGKGIPPLSGNSGENTQVVCGLFQERWIGAEFDNGNGIWLQESPARGVEPPTGGLFGNASIINVGDGTMFTYEATAIDNFWTPREIGHTDPGNLAPSLASGDRQSTVFLSGQAQPETVFWDNSIDAVNHILALETLMNEYNIEPGLGANSEWVMTFPTKRQHTDAAPGGARDATDGARAPFTTLWLHPNQGGTPHACETIDLNVWDREEQAVRFGTDGDICPSPRPIDPVTGDPVPCGPETVRFSLCREANVVRFGAADQPVPAFAEITGEPSSDEAVREEYGFVNFPLPQDPYAFTAGWARFDFSEFKSEASAEGEQFTGLPVVGFWANTYTRDDLSAGVLSNYGGSFQHRGSRVPVEPES